MSKSLADVLKEHDAPMRERLAGLGRRARDCRCGLIVYVPEAEDTKEAFAEHQTAMLKEAGFGSQHDAWDRGFSDGMRQWQMQRKDPTHPITRTNPYSEALRKAWNVEWGFVSATGNVSAVASKSVALYTGAPVVSRVTGPWTPVDGRASTTFTVDR